MSNTTVKNIAIILVMCVIFGSAIILLRQMIIYNRQQRDQGISKR